MITPSRARTDRRFLHHEQEIAAVTTTKIQVDMTAPVVALPAQFKGLTLARLAGDVVAHARDG